MLLQQINEIKAHLRDITIGMVDELPLKIDLSKRYNKKFRIFYPNRKLIKSVIKNGGVLTGSRALRCYTINGRSILNRRTKDWDFLVTKEQALKICSDQGIKYNLLDNVISVEGCRYWAHPAYSDSYRVGPVDVQLIIKDHLPNFNEVNGIRLATPMMIISEKMKLINEIGERFAWDVDDRIRTDERKELVKHVEDITEFIIHYQSNNI